MASPTVDNQPLPYRVGHGFDLHRLERLTDPDHETGPLILAGVTIEHDRGPVGHSDGDAVYHAVTDAILGALGEPDIGELFPDTSPKWKGARSTIFVQEAMARMRRAGYGVGNIDVTIILQRPKISPHKDAMRVNIAELLDIGTNRVNIKGKTHEHLDALGAGAGVAVHVAVLLMQHP